MHESGDRLNVFSHEYDVEQPKSSGEQNGYDKLGRGPSVVI